MNIKTTTVTGILRLAKARIERRYEHLDAKRETLRANILQRWPEDTYGMRWLDKYDKRSAALALELKRCAIAMVGLKNLIHEIDYNLGEY